MVTLKKILIIGLVSILNAQIPGPMRTPPMPQGTVQEVSQLTQYGITWVFDKKYLTGTFANGDYWVAGDPVVITRITPDFTGTDNGWEVNPVVNGLEGFSDDIGFFDSSLVPKLPYKALPGQSIVKTVRSSKSGTPNNCFECLKTAAVLTIVKTTPPDSGANMFRPAYVGNTKKALYITDLKTDLLPSYAPVNSMPTLETIYEQFRRVQLDHKTGVIGRNLHPTDNMEDYQPDMARLSADAALRLMMNDPISSKKKALIAFVQYGIDLYEMMKYGHTWPPGGGHMPGIKLPLSFAATLLQDDSMAMAISKATFFHEDQLVYFSKKVNRGLFGDNPGYADYEKRYWNEAIQFIKTKSDAVGYMSFKDPYEYIDGCFFPGAGYQGCCISQPWKGSVAALLLMPSIIKAWGDTTAIVSYVRRWVSIGVWTQPDPCAPPDTVSTHYGTAFGPDGNGGCIQDKDSSDGIGRFPKRHGELKDGGGQKSIYQMEMWNAYIK